MHSFCKAAFALGFQDICKNNLDSSTEFLQHVAEFGLSYGTQEEYLFRQEIFDARGAEYKVINADKNNTFTVGHNFMSTWTDDEYNKLLGYKAIKDMIGEETTLNVENIPANIDWRQIGAVTEVKQQGHCGSCWAFGSTAAIEGHNFIKTGHLKSLSEQELVSCLHKHAHGCKGGNSAAAMRYIETNGQVLESEYPYKSEHGQDGACLKKGTPHVFVSKVNNVPSNSSEQLKAAISKGPVTVGVDASKILKGYKNGIINSPSCGTDIDHFIAAVGYGVEKGQEYYIAKNSWGNHYGEGGYVRIATQKTGPGICAIQKYSVWPSI